MAMIPLTKPPTRAASTCGSVSTIAVTWGMFAAVDVLSDSSTTMLSVAGWLVGDDVKLAGSAGAVKDVKAPAEAEVDEDKPVVAAGVVVGMPVVDIVGVV
jgi:hypothetical protein